MAALGPKGTLINVARGSVVDEEAMIAALQSGALGWAGLDVFAEEPHVPQALRDLPQTVLLPHVGSATIETRAAMGALTVDNLLQHLDDGTVISPVPECDGL
jgi:lactate dehydrogenase-like 2-hydroxyacid dehydrogenase